MLIKRALSLAVSRLIPLLGEIVKEVYMTKHSYQTITPLQRNAIQKSLRSIPREIELANEEIEQNFQVSGKVEEPRLSKGNTIECEERTQQSAPEDIVLIFLHRQPCYKL